MATIKVIFTCDTDELPDICGGLGNRKFTVHPIEGKEKPAPQETHEEPPQEAYEPLRASRANPSTKDIELGMVLGWPSTGALLKAFQHNSICRRPDFEAALITVGYKPSSWSNIIWHLRKFGIVERLSPGTYQYKGLRTGASE